MRIIADHFIVGLLCPISSVSRIKIICNFVLIILITLTTLPVQVVVKGRKESAKLFMNQSCLGILLFISLITNIDFDQGTRQQGQVEPCWRWSYWLLRPASQHTHYLFFSHSVTFD